MGENGESVVMSLLRAAGEGVVDSVHRVADSVASEEHEKCLTLCTMSLIKAVDDPYGKGKRAIVDALVEVWDLRKSEAEDCIRFARHVAIPSLDLEAFLRDELGWRSSEAINYVSANVHYLEQVPSLCEAKTPKELYEKLEDLNARRSLGRA
ncbi:MAG: hypothetical protein LKF00_09240 [Olsenella sp.]|nr:hypothetical protein [Olsenella sp.]MCI1289068.1 hypothetical protein [Olsenella sp.]